MSKKRKSVITITSLTLVALMLIGFTLAFLTDQKRVLNVLGLGVGSSVPGGDPENPDNLSVLLKLHEPKFAVDPNVTPKTYNAGTATEYKEYTMMNISPGDHINKDPKVKNVGRDNCYVRMQLVDKNKVTTQYPNGTPISNTDLTTGIYQYIGVEVTENWVYNTNDKFWYYNEETKDLTTTGTKWAPGKEMPIFVEKSATVNGADVKYTMFIPRNANNTQLNTIGKIFKLEVVAEAIQEKNFTPNLTLTNPWSDNGVAVPVIPAVR